MKRSPIFLAPVFLVISACDDAAAPDTEREAEQGGAVAGDVLGGSISDDMLPLEELRSQSPPARQPSTATPTSQRPGGTTTAEAAVETAPEEDDLPPTPEPELPTETE